MVTGGCCLQDQMRYDYLKGGGRADGPEDIEEMDFVARGDAQRPTAVS